jgi:hypothetical protein
MRPLAMTRVWLKSADPFGHDIPSERKRTVNGNVGLEGVSIGADCVTVGRFPGRSDRSETMHVWSVARVFHTC